METILSALIAGGVTLVGVLISNSKTQAVNSQRIEQMREDIARLESKQDKHNSLIERMYKVESDLATAFHRIDDLREEMRK